MKKLNLSKIRIMPVYGGAYAWDENGYNISLSYWFIGHPQYNEILKLESEMEVWASEIYSVIDNDPNFPWKDYNNKGRELTKKLAEFMIDSNTEIVYARPYEDPDGKNLCEERFLKRCK